MGTFNPKSSIASLFVLFSSLLTIAQPYGHEWIDFNNPNPTFKFPIVSEGLYRIDQVTMSTALQQQGLSLANVDPRDIQVFARGEQIPVYIEGESDGSFDANDFIELYAYGNDGWLDTRLYADPSHQPNKYYSLFNDTIHYYITWNSNPNAQHERLQQVPNNISNPPAKEEYFMHTLVQEYHNERQAGESFAVAGQYLYNSNFERGEGYLGSDFNKSSQTRNIIVPNIYTASNIKEAQVRTNMASYFNQQHRIRFSLNGNVAFDTVFSGEQVNLFTHDIPLTQFNNNGTPDAFLYEALGTGSSDRNAIGYISITYPRTFDLNNANQFKLQLDGAVGTSKYVEFDNFDHQGVAPVLHDIANGQRMLGSVSGNQVRYRINLFQQPEADLFITAAPTIQSISSLQVVTFYDFSDPSHQGDYILVYHPALKDDGQGNDWVTEYIKHRESSAGGNHSVIPLDINVLYDQFSYGINKHSLAIKNMVHLLVDSLSPSPRHLFLMGKSLEYQISRTDQTRYSQNLVPTYGQPGSDYMLTTSGTALEGKIAVGRLGARNGNAVRVYYDKIRALELNQNDPRFTIRNKAWMKTALHLAGGGDATQQELFNLFLQGYENTFRAPSMGGDVVSFQKTSSEPIQFVKSQFLDSLISGGLSVITFFGHSSNNSFDVSLDDPNNYDNYGKYPVLISNGCFSGQIHSTAYGVSDRFIFAEDRGAIGFLASVSFGEAQSLNQFTSLLYRNFSRFTYNSTFGESLRTTLSELGQAGTNPTDFMQMLVQQNSLHGDPAVRLNTYDKPEYVVEAEQVRTIPAQVSLETDSFDISLQLFNLGRALDTSFTIEVQRTFPNGTIDLKQIVVDAPYFFDTYTITFPTDRLNGVGINQFTITVDALGVVDEMDETNNFHSFEILIQSSEALPLYPYDFGIVSRAPVTLHANSANLLSREQPYTIQIDTTIAFNSALLEESTVTQSGGVIAWTPTMAWQDEQVYYWRISPAFSHPDSANWNTSSFVFLQGSDPGWNQSHRYQFGQNSFSNLQQAPNGDFKFIDDVKEVQLTNCIYSFHNWDEVSRVIINGDMVQSWSYLGHGVIVTVIDSLTGLAWRHVDHDYGERGYNHSTMREAFHYRIDNLGERASLIEMLDSVPDGHLVIVQSFQRPSYKGLKADTTVLGTSLLHKLRDKGGQALFYLDTLNYQPPWMLVFRQGNPNAHFEMIGSSPSSYLDTTLTLTGLWTEGLLTGTWVGPAKNWGSVSWGIDETVPLPENDSISVGIVGLRSDASIERIKKPFGERDTLLTGVFPVDFPSIRLESFMRDATNRTAPQLDFWRVFFDPVGDATFNPSKRFSVSSDSLMQGETFALSTIIENVTPHDLDTLPIVAYLIRSDGSRLDVLRDTIDQLVAGDTVHIDVSFATSGYAGRSVLVLEANPDKSVIEQYYFNNQLQVSLVVMSDNSNPLLDVTFDGRHIMDGELVSARPEIKMQLKDENTFLALNDTSLMEVFLYYPTGLQEKIAMGDPRVEFIPADSNNLQDGNKATLIFRPDFKSDGEYRLVVRARDRSGNSAGKLDYQVSFEVITTSMISNVLNYPNPFTSRTQFVFTLTGAEVPEFMKIQIMTVSGKVIREVTQEELGPLHIGINRSEFWWDGTDQYGDPVANGLYLYRVVARQNGQQMEQLANDRIDRYFESGFGKMYLAR